MLKKLLGLSLAMAFLVSNPAHAAVVSLASPYTVTSTSFTNVPGIQLNNVQCTSASFNGGLITMWLCVTTLTIKDVQQSNIQTRALFGNTAGSLQSTTNRPDGSVTRVYMAANPSGLTTSGKITVKGQVARVPVQGFVPLSVIVLDPPTGDVFKIES